MTDHGLRAESGRQGDLWKLRGFPGTGFSSDDDRLPLEQRLCDLRSFLQNRQRLVKARPREPVDPQLSDPRRSGDVVL
jgi:hypothetical protein